MREISAGVIVYRRTKEGPKFLLLYHGGSYWSFPKGKLVEGEPSFKAALREVAEETGIDPKDLQFRNQFHVNDRFTYVRNREKIWKTVTYYLAETKKVEVKLKTVPPDHRGERHEGYGWFLLRDALRVVQVPNLKRHLKKAHDTVIHGKSVRRHPQDSARTGHHVPKNRPAA
ncbi:MAG: NUDIX domain-containing protein [Candidatus Jorgensenbacteria bacterium]|nr:NUDIX domain-containing protein [Candidatus Jorgensenbacteria bacterium]